ncbi:MAG: EAL domain-containing protein, partial [Sulfurimonas sp.]
LYRIMLASRYATNINRYTIKKWKKLYLSTLAISNILWIFPPFLFFNIDNMMIQSAIIILYIGLSVSAINSLLFFIKAYNIFLVMVLGPIILVLFMQQTELYIAMGFLMSLFFGLLLMIGRRFYKAYEDIFKFSTLYEEEKQKSTVSEERFEILFKAAPVGFVFYDKKLIVREVNKKFAEFLEESEEFLVGLDLHILGDQRILPALKAAIDNKQGNYDGSYAIPDKHKNMFISMQTSPIRDDMGEVIGAIGIIADTTEKMRAQQQVERQAKYDLLTNIPNRITLKEHIDREIMRYQRHGVVFAVLFLDIDHFKNINDSLGHAMGDKLLVEVSYKLQDIIRREDIVSRLGGDEFVILAPDLSHDHNVAAAKAEQIATKIYEHFKEPIHVDEHSLKISASIGIALVSSTEDKADDILKHADLAMYAAKEDGRDTKRFYKEEMEAWVQRRVQLESGFKKSLENGELDVYYQPIVEVQSGNIIGAEALLRWHSQEFGCVEPEEFIPVAEESGLIMQVGDFVMQRAFEQFLVWKKEFKDLHKLQKIAINVSVRQFNTEDFISKLKKAIKLSGIDPKNVEIEIVESIVIDDIETARVKMEEMRALGISLSIDDFGTGYSSLSYLKQLPFTVLKIDRAFIKDLSVDEDDKELVETILNIAKRFKLHVVAEGVETAEHYRFLKDKGCDYFQGYYCSQALTSEDMVNLLTENKCLMFKD